MATALITLSTYTMANLADSTNAMQQTTISSNPISQSTSNMNNFQSNADAYMRVGDSQCPVNTVSGYAAKNSADAKASLDGVHTDSGSSVVGMGVNIPWGSVLNKCHQSIEANILAKKMEMLDKAASFCHNMHQYGYNSLSPEVLLKAKIIQPDQMKYFALCEHLDKARTTNPKMYQQQIHNLQQALAQKPKQVVKKEKVMVGAKEWRIRFQDFVPCSSCGKTSVSDYAADIRKHLDNETHLFLEPYEKSGEERVSVYVRGNFLTKTEAFKYKMVFDMVGIPSKIVPVRGTEIYEYK